MAAVEVFDVTRSFPAGRGRQRRALDGVSLEIRRGEMVALLGASGSGKSTLLRHLAGLLCADRHTGGTVRIDGITVQQDGRLGRQVRTARARTGMIFQQFNLVGRLPLITNVLVGLLQRVPWWRSLPMWFTSVEQEQAMLALARVGMAQFAAQRASTLSGGQQQRAAIARALVQGARLILGDEPIASLDPESARRVMEALAAINREDGVTVVVSLHQVDFALAFCPRTIALKDGQVVYDGPTAGLGRDLLARIYGGDPRRAVPAPVPVGAAPEPELAIA